MRLRRCDGLSPCGSWRGFEFFAPGAVLLLAGLARAKHDESVTPFAAEAAAVTSAVDQIHTGRVRTHIVRHDEVRKAASRNERHPWPSVSSSSKRCSPAALRGLQAADAREIRASPLGCCDAVARAMADDNVSTRTVRFDPAAAVYLLRAHAYRYCASVYRLYTGPLRATGS